MARPQPWSGAMRRVLLLGDVSVPIPGQDWTQEGAARTLVLWLRAFLGAIVTLGGGRSWAVGTWANKTSLGVAQGCRSLLFAREAGDEREGPRVRMMAVGEVQLARWALDRQQTKAIVIVSRGAAPSSAWSVLASWAPEVAHRRWRHLPKIYWVRGAGAVVRLRSTKDFPAWFKPWEALGWPVPWEERRIHNEPPDQGARTTQRITMAAWVEEHTLRVLYTRHLFHNKYSTRGRGWRQSTTTTTTTTHVSESCSLSVKTSRRAARDRRTGRSLRA